ncbi:hypothetical protein [Inquilinus sp. CA228]|uniref:hypothetical protein n=1 Tax=Inquilinus sp. CA228 TaxID=3455609 RepID=UPI003F8D718B
MVHPRAAAAMLQLRHASMLRCEGLVNRFGEGNRPASDRFESRQSLREIGIAAEIDKIQYVAAEP